MHHFTIDVEEYFHPTALSDVYNIEGWDTLERRTPVVLDRLLGFLDKHGVVGTFFVLGWLAEREPLAVKRIHAAGHEIASHGYAHRLVRDLGQQAFRDSVRKSKDVLEDLVGTDVLGYRAPSFSITPGLEWAFDVLVEEGYEYDASLFPIGGHPTYGYSLDNHEPQLLITPEGRSLAEFPATTCRLAGRQLPASGGAYFRLLPYALVRAGLKQAQDRGVAGMFYLHPWELDEWTPDVRIPRLQRLRTFGGRVGLWERLTRLVSEFTFSPIRASPLLLDHQ